jgi:LmbE family N-acetylglucosaminyl deacetylase
MAQIFGIVSPHLDDGILSCGELLAAHPGSLLITVFTGGPAIVDPLPVWDQLCGIFHPGDDVPAVRRQEDIEAAETLATRCVHLGFWDAQYRDAPLYGYSGPRDIDLTAAIATALRETFEENAVDTIIIPIGIWHEDHRITASACLDIAEGSSDVDCWIYEDLPYRAESPRDLAIAKKALHSRGHQMSPLDLIFDRFPDRKRHALEQYASQLKPLAARLEVAINGPETYHRIIARSFQKDRRLHRAFFSRWRVRRARCR